MPFFSFLIIIAFIALVIYLCWYNSPKQKGKRGEARIHDVIMQLPDEYHVLDDVVLPTNRGTTQIDHIVVSKYGVFAIETKNYRGDIYGDDDRQEIDAFATYIHRNYPGYHVAWYSGRVRISSEIDRNNFEYIKIGPYLKHLGSLKDKTTNQRLYRRTPDNTLEDITHRFWRS